MKTFKNFLNESAEVKALKHLYHPEELVFLEGEKGVTTAINFITQTMNTLYQTQSSARISRKWDGAPAVVFGHIDGNFFVGSKSVFNKEPKINYIEEDVVANHSGSPGLMEKLLVALKYLKPITPKDGKIYQGDFLFDEKIRTSKSIKGEENYVFRPNTITYAVPTNSETGKSIGKAKMGIVIHTFYMGLDDSAQFLPSLKGFKKSKDCFFVDAEVELGDKIMLDPGEMKTLIVRMNELDQLNKRLASTGFYRMLDSNTGKIVSTFNNTLIRGNRKPDPLQAFNDLVKYVDARLQADIDKLKSEAGKARKSADKERILHFFSSQRNGFIMAYKIYNDLMEIKGVLVNKFNSIKKFGTFIDDGSTFVPTNDEGFVIVSGEGVLKLVDRFEFSKNNFNLVKAW